MSAAPYPHLHPLLRLLRGRRGLTQEQLAEQADCDYKHYQLIEIGRTSMPALATLEKLASALGVKTWVLLCDDAEIVADHTGLTAEQLTKRIVRRPGRPRQT